MMAILTRANRNLRCWLCERPLGERVEWHHPVPKSRGGRMTVAVHPICHRTIHATLSNAQLARGFGVRCPVRFLREALKAGALAQHQRGDGLVFLVGQFQLPHGRADLGARAGLLLEDLAAQGAGKIRGLLEHGPERVEEGARPLGQVSTCRRVFTHSGKGMDDSFLLPFGQ